MEAGAEYSPKNGQKKCTPSRQTLENACSQKQPSQ